MGTKKKSLKEGLTTGTCAAAATAAAVDLLLGKPSATASVELPDEQKEVSVAIKSAAIMPVSGGLKAATAAVIKDAGDDPDVTHRAQIEARVSIVESETTRVKISGGTGVGRVTRPGLPVAVGEPAINPVPRNMIKQEVLRRLPEEKNFTVEVTISVKNGEQLARRTLNPRLGIVGGISILGTSGRVKPFSAQSYRETIDICLRSARANDQKMCVLSTGRRSERLAQARYTDLEERCFVQIADFFSYALAQAVELEFITIVLTAFFGKLCKWAMNMPYTHAKSGLTDFTWLAQLASESGLSQDYCELVKNANNARAIFTSGHPEVPLFVEAVAQKALYNAENIINHRTHLVICLWDFNESFYKKWESQAA